MTRICRATSCDRPDALFGLRLTLVVFLMLASGAAASKEAVILLHGLARSAASMDVMASAVEARGYQVVNLDYPSTRHPIETLVERFLKPVVEQLQGEGIARVHFVTHSMGGILVRQYVHRHGAASVGRVVMLGPPNRGSELVDKLGHLPPFQWLNGPAGLQLGTDPESLPNRLGKVDFELGVIAGTRSYNPLYSWMIDGRDDGKVSVERAGIEGASELLILPVNHTFMMKNSQVISQSLQFIAQGKFDR